MKRILGILGLTALLATAAVAKEFDTVAETTYRQVTWADFKGREHRGDRWSNGSWAHIVSGIRVDSGELRILQLGDGDWRAALEDADAYAVMDKFLSAASPGAAKPQVLAHEQLHFDLTEAYARRLTAQMIVLEGQGADAEAAGRDLREKLKKAYDDGTGALRQLQDQYDQETANGTVKKAQEQWRERIGEIFSQATAELANVKSRT